MLMDNFSLNSLATSNILISMYKLLLYFTVIISFNTCAQTRGTYTNATRKPEQLS